MFKSVLPALLLTLTFASRSFAADEKKKSEGQSALKIEETTGQKNKVPGDIDEEITNTKLRADSGSKSKWSGSFTGAYYGASMEKPFDKNRPDTNQEGTPPKVNMQGLLGMRYRMDKSNSISLGTGVSLTRPFHEAKKGNVSDPYVSFTNVRKLGGIQNIAGASLSAATDHDEVVLGQQATADINNTMMYDFRGSKGSIGLVLDGSYTRYQNNRNELVTWQTDDGPQTFRAGSQERDLNVAVYPVAEYAFNDRVNLRTVFRPLIFDHVVRTGDQGGAWRKRRWTQSIGVGFALTRDIFLYPNFQFDWYQWQSDDFNFFRKNTRANSTIGLSASINVF